MSVIDLPHIGAWEVATPPEAERWAGLLGRICRAGDCIALIGDLGVGKTTFSRGLIRAFTEDPALAVVSPSFTLVQPYLRGGLTLWHFDLYRLKYREELQELGLEEALDEGVTVIEWPDSVAAELPASRLEIRMRFARDAERRIWHVHGNQAWEQRISEIWA